MISKPEGKWEDIYIIFMGGFKKGIVSGSYKLFLSFWALSKHAVYIIFEREFNFNIE